jgi:flagellar basal body-associated protein FliL
MNKKAQDLSISTIIIAAIAVVVLVVIVAIFTGRLGIFTSVLGTTGAEKTRDSALYKCIPSDQVYDILEKAQVNYNKDPSPANKNALDEAIKDRNNELGTCKDQTSLPSACTGAGKCQWVGA